MKSTNKKLNKKKENSSTSSLSSSTTLSTSSTPPSSPSPTPSIPLNCNLKTLLNYLQQQFAIISQNKEQEIIDSNTQINQINYFKKWFNENRYTATFPFNQIYLSYQYFYHLKLNNKQEIETIHSKIPSDILYSYNYLLSESIENLQTQILKLEFFASNCMIIKYKDGINQQWSEPWHIESRSPICLCINNEWRVIPAMPRGPEVAGDKEHNISQLQDVNINDDKSILHFAPHYQVERRLKQYNYNFSSFFSSPLSFPLLTIFIDI